MGLLTILRKLKEKEREMKVLILGLDGSGKSTIVSRLKGDDGKEISPTLGFEISTVLYRASTCVSSSSSSNGQNESENNEAYYRLNMCDVGGQASIRAYWRNYFERTDGLVWVVDSCDTAERMQLCVDQLAAVLGEERLAGVPLIVVANKQDLGGARSVADVEALLEKCGIDGRPCQVVACSALGTDDELRPLHDGLAQFIGDIAEQVAYT
jgi:ADP-ribosylation factor-like protein 2